MAELQETNAPETEKPADLPRSNPVIAIEKAAEPAPVVKTPIHETPQLERPPTQPAIINEQPITQAAVDKPPEVMLPTIAENPPVPAPENPPEAPVITDREQLSLLESSLLELTSPPDEAAAFTGEETPAESVESYVSNPAVDADPVLNEAIELPITELTETDVLSPNEITIDDEVMETFEQLETLVSIEHEVVAAEAPEPYEYFVQDMVIPLNPEAPEAVEPNAFEEFLLERPEPNAIPDIETIIDSADEQPLEETLAQLSFYLAETDREPSDTALKDALREVIEALPHDTIGNDAIAEKPVITPDLTQKLLTLLETAGYSNPREVLVEFIGQHDLEFLLQAIRYLYQLNDDISRYEFLLSKRTFTAMATSDPLANRLGRAIMRLSFYRPPLRQAL